jgi:hypothetical protein
MRSSRVLGVPRVVAAGILAAAILAAGGCAGAKARAGAPDTPPSPTDEMRMPWEPASAGFLRQWLVCGVFPSPERPQGQGAGDPSRQGHDTDFLSAAGGEVAVRPAAGQTVARPDGSAAAWTPYAGKQDVVDLTVVFAGQPVSNVVAYAYTTFRHAEGGKAMLAFGSDDSAKVWLNGDLVHDVRAGRAVRPDEDVVPVTLRAGDNAILVKVENGPGGWGFAVRVLSESAAQGLDVGDIRPRLEPPSKDAPDALVVATDVGLGAMSRKVVGVRVEAVAPGGRVVADVEAKRGETVRLQTRDWPDGPYEIRVSSPRPEGGRVWRHLPWFKGDWLKEACALLAAGARTREASADPADLRIAMLGRLVLDRLGADPMPMTAQERAARFGAGGWAPVHSALLEYRELTLGPGADVRPGGFVRLAWRDPVDDSPQFARAYLPPDYDPAKPWPLVVVLHGYNPPNPPYVQWWSVAERHSDLAERHGVIVLEPHGRGNNSYLGIGDADVLRAIAEAKAAFRVDADRVYLMGYSMGGGGTWHVGTRHPETFAAIGPIYGGWDYHVGMDEAKRAKLTPRARYDLERESSFAQAEALLTTPVFVNHGDADDLVDIDHTRYVVRMMQRWGYAIRYWEHPGLGHGALGCEDELVRVFLACRLDPMPREVRVRSADLRFAAAHWVRVEQGEDPFAFMQVRARVADRDTIRLDTENVLAVRLAPGEPLVDRGGPVRVIWNGEDAGAHRFADGAIRLRQKGTVPGRVCKTPEVPGRISDVQATPFAIVAGTASKDPRMARFVRRAADLAREGWADWQHAPPRFFLDTEITDDDIARYSLLLYGGPDENLVTRKLIADLPLAIGPDAVTVAGQTFAAHDASVTMVYPNPRNPDRYVLVQAGTSPAGMFFSDRRPEGYDFVITDTRARAAEPDTPEDRLLVAAGCFDRDWQYDERYVARGDAAARARARVRKAPAYLTAAAAAPRRALSEVLETSASGSFRAMERDLDWQGRPLRIGGRTYASGIGLAVWHEPCKATYDLAGGNWRRLRGDLGIEIDDPGRLEPRQKQGTCVYFVVRGDGKELYRSPTLRWNARGPVQMDVNVSGVRMLELEVANEATWHNAASSVNWGDLGLEK